MSSSMIHALLILSAEVIVLLLVVGSVFLFFRLRNKKKDAHAATQLVDDLKKNEPDRRENLTQVFKDVYGIEGDELGTVVNEFIDREKAFYKVLLSTYLKRDASKLQTFGSELEKMVLPYMELVPKDMVDSSEVDALNADLEQLKKENSELGGELSSSKGIIDEMMSEYSRAFDKGAETDKDLPEAATGEDKPADEEGAEISADSQTEDSESDDEILPESEAEVDIVVDEPDNMDEVPASETDGLAETELTDSETPLAEAVGEVADVSENEIDSLLGGLDADLNSDSEDTAVEGGLADDEIDALFDEPAAGSQEGEVIPESEPVTDDVSPELDAASAEDVTDDAQDENTDPVSSPEKQQVDLSGSESDDSQVSDPTMSDSELDALFDSPPAEDAGASDTEESTSVDIDLGEEGSEPLEEPSMDVVDLDISSDDSK